VSVLSRRERHTLVECHPHTGRTHQIRVHLEIAGFPIPGDKLYGQPDEDFLSLLDGGVTPALREAIGFPRHALHAHALAFPHPHSGQMLKVRAPLPADMQAVADGAEPCCPDVDEKAEIEASDEE
jgi:23S rRNA pseudouridine1911/1915/1917 synthase